MSSSTVDPRVTSLSNLEYSGVTQEHLIYSRMISQCTPRDRLIINFFRQYRADIITEYNHHDSEIHIFVDELTQEDEEGVHCIDHPQLQESIEDIERELGHYVHVIIDRYGVTLEFYNITKLVADILCLLDRNRKTSIRYDLTRPKIPNSFEVSDIVPRVTGIGRIQEIQDNDPDIFTYITLQSTVRSELSKALRENATSCLGFNLLPEVYEVMKDKPFRVNAYNRLTVGDYSVLDSFTPWKDLVSVRGQHTIKIESKYLDTLYAIYLITTHVSLM